MGYLSDIQDIWVYLKSASIPLVDGTGYAAKRHPSYAIVMPQWVANNLPSGNSYGTSPFKKIVNHRTTWTVFHVSMAM